ncbi:MAG: cyclic-di-AMP receptor [Oscillospiraceae bacterium]|nr:cyclic-di-AMP receptor [Oscillospiraceae bacterium]
MKLIFAVINDDDFRGVSDALNTAGFQSTRLSSTGGFLRSGNSTLLICVDDEKLEDCIDIIKHNCRKRKQYVPTTAVRGNFAAKPLEVTIGGATIFVTEVDRFEKF